MTLTVLYESVPSARVRMRKNPAIRLVHRIVVTRVIARTRTPDQIAQFVCSKKVIF
jgi:hypothetical protein